jgi:acetylornithine deacetylase/succinyl-diaminopimelate desuccinylase-like protein
MIDTNYFTENKDRFLTELLALLRIPSISADSAYKSDVMAAANFIKDKLIIAGADKVEVCETAGNPIVYGEKIIDPNLPTVLVYGHYDVQPAVPLELWETPPFEPTIRQTAIHPEGAIFARGACDDKGQVYMHV